ncbi:MAG: periplasmic heavy metal sensor [Verrucomicrobiales bacterium]|nr:periplasmic heavy metal sensor [Verrucomicrobiales bacterium]MCP5527583.1 periplasmic heavy metal sensor [Verrucomicrobiales bacterium]
MRRAGWLFAGVLLLAAAGFASAYWAGGRLASLGATSPDDLDWLRLEFHLTEAELDRIRALHEAYVPVCEHNCHQIAAAKEALDRLLAAGDLGDPAIEEQLAEIGRLRARCQAAMLRHFQAVSRAMPTEPGRRYLEAMQQLTLHAHEAVEHRMAGESAEGHGHH